MKPKQEVLNDLADGEIVMFYLTRKDGDVVGYREHDKAEYSHTILHYGETSVDQYHGQARSQGETLMYDLGARYFVAFRKTRIRLEVTNSGRLVKS